MSDPFNRHVGMIVLEVVMSNPNGDPDMESEPRVREQDGRGMISPPSVKRKYRDLVDNSDLMEEARKALALSGQYDYQILEKRGRDRNEIKKMKRDAFIKHYWDARLFGNTFLEVIEDKKKKDDLGHFINTGVLQIGVGLSVAPIRIERMTFTNKSGVQEGKSRGMAPLAFKVVVHGIYCIPFFVNPSVAKKTGATQKDLELFKFLTPHIYTNTASTIRPQVSILHAWCAEHNNALGSCPDYRLLDALKPKVRGNVDEPFSLQDYEIPSLKTDEVEKIRDKFKEIVDLNFQ